MPKQIPKAWVKYLTIIQLKKRLARQAKGYVRQEFGSVNSCKKLFSMASTIKKLMALEANRQ